MPNKVPERDRFAVPWPRLNEANDDRGNRPAHPGDHGSKTAPETSARGARGAAYPLLFGLHVALIEDNVNLASGLHNPTD